MLIAISVALALATLLISGVTAILSVLRTGLGIIFSFVLPVIADTVVVYIGISIAGIPAQRNFCLFCRTVIPVVADPIAVVVDNGGRAVPVVADPVLIAVGVVGLGAGCHSGQRGENQGQDRYDDCK